MATILKKGCFCIQLEPLHVLVPNEMAVFNECNHFWPMIVELVNRRHFGKFILCNQKEPKPTVQRILVRLVNADAQECPLQLLMGATRNGYFGMLPVAYNFP